eukprot:4089795-Prymnesium_polylepis.2
MANLSKNGSRKHSNSAACPRCPCGQKKGWLSGRLASGVTACVTAHHVHERWDGDLAVSNRSPGPGEQTL